MTSVLSDTLTSNEKVIQVDNFLANVNFSEPKVFYVRNNLNVSYRYTVIPLYAVTPPMQFCKIMGLSKSCLDNVVMRDLDVLVLRVQEEDAQAEILPYNMK